MKRGIAVLLAAALAAGCQGSAKGSRHMRPELEAPAEAWKGVGTIVVMPPDNWTSDLGLEYIGWYRAVINELVRERGYAAVPVAEVNRFMLSNKFALGGEVRLYGVDELARTFKADAVMYWNITAGGPVLEIFIDKADGTKLWSSGEVRLKLKFNAYPSGGYHGSDDEFAMVLGDIVRRLPGRQP